MNKGTILHNCQEQSSRVADARSTLAKLKDRQVELEQRLDELNRDNERMAGKLTKNVTDDRKFSDLTSQMRKNDTARADASACLERVTSAIPAAMDALKNADAIFAQAIQQEAQVVADKLSPLACDALSEMFKAFDEYEALREEIRRDCHVAIGDCMSVKQFFDDCRCGRGKEMFHVWRRIESCFLRDSVLAGRD